MFYLMNISLLRDTTQPKSGNLIEKSAAPCVLSFSVILNYIIYIATDFNHHNIIMHDTLHH